jgi:hypothetical protein
VATAIIQQLETPVEILTQPETPEEYIASLEQSNTFLSSFLVLRSPAGVPIAIKPGEPNRLADLRLYMQASCAVAGIIGITQDAAEIKFLAWNGLDDWLEWVVDQTIVELDKRARAAGFPACSC